MENVWVVSTCDVIDFDITTSRKVFSTEEKAREEFNEIKALILADAICHFDTIGEDDDDGVDGVICESDNHYSIHKSYEASVWESSVIIEELPVN